jgi:hypothetical protein
VGRHENIAESLLEKPDSIDIHPRQFGRNSPGSKRLTCLIRKHSVDIDAIQMDAFIAIPEG